MTSVNDDLQRQLRLLTAENARLRGQWAVARHWDPPAALEDAFGTGYGWRCLTVSLPTGDLAPRTVILIEGSGPGTGPGDPGAAGKVWRYLLTAAPVCGRIGPFARASMPAGLLGYLGEQDGRPVIVLNAGLARGQVKRAARMLAAAVSVQADA